MALIPSARLIQQQLKRNQIEPDYEALYERPKTRGDCLAGGVNEARPCPWVSCKHHLYLDVTEYHNCVRPNDLTLEPWELKETCALDVADRFEGMTLEAVGELLNRTRERVRQIESSALTKVREASNRDEFDEPEERINYGYGETEE